MYFRNNFQTYSLQCNMNFSVFFLLFSEFFIHFWYVFASFFLRNSLLISFSKLALLFTFNECTQQSSKQNPQQITFYLKCQQICITYINYLHQNLSIIDVSWFGAGGGQFYGSSKFKLHIFNIGTEVWWNFFVCQSPGIHPFQPCL